MRRRTRTLAGVLALVAMAFSFTETVLAATCAPASETAARTGSVSDGGSSLDYLFMAGRDQNRDGGDRDDRCPVGQAMGCVTAASLPASPSAMSAAPLEAASPIVSDDIRPDLLLAHALFHPPRA